MFSEYLHISLFMHYILNVGVLLLSVGLSHVLGKTYKTGKFSSDAGYGRETKHIEWNEEEMGQGGQIGPKRGWV